MSLYIGHDKIQKSNPLNPLQVKYCPGQKKRIIEIIIMVYNKNIFFS